MEYLFGIIILLGALIFFHELGHFLVAKFYGVKVEVFSLGFGTKILKKKIGETEYCLSLIPLGGYVKLYGEDPTDPVKGTDAKRSFSNQPVFRRIAIAGAGPIANIILAIFVFFVISIFGLERIIVPYLADVIPGSQAWELGLRPGDQLLTINQKKITRWHEDFLAEIAKAPKGDQRELSLTVQRKDKMFDVQFVPTIKEDWNMYCEKEKIGILEGISVFAASPTVGITGTESWAAKAGFQSGDRILALNGVQIDTWRQLKEYLYQIVQKELSFKVARGDQIVDLQVTLPPEYFLLQEEQKEHFLGMYSYGFFIKEDFKEGTAGHAAGLKVGDRLVLMNDKPIQDWEIFKKDIQTYGNNPGHFYLTYDRGGELNRVQVFPLKTVAEHPCGEKQEQYQIGIIIDFDHAPPKVERYFELNPFKALYYGIEKSFSMAVIIIKSVYKMFQGKVPLKAMGGPILIGKIAGDHLKQGLYPFLVLLAMISVNLAVLNLLPIPVLDGGHLFFFVCEAIRGRPLSNKVFEFANKAGLAIILGLIILTFYNDISRYWVNILSFFKKIIGIA